MSTRKDGRTKRSIFGTDKEWLTLRRIASEIAEDRGKNMSPTDAFWLIVGERDGKLTNALLEAEAALDMSSRVHCGCGPGGGFTCTLHKGLAIVREALVAEGLLEES